MPEWKLYQSGNAVGDQMTLDIAKEVRLLLIKTAEVHFRDFGNVKISDFVDLVNNTYNEENWHKIRCRYNDEGAIDIAICYHLVKHLGKEWSVTVGFDSELVPAPGRFDPGVPEPEYEALAVEIGRQIQTDLGSDPFGKKTQFFMFDDTESDRRPEPEAKLRATPIGELIWTACNSREVNNEFGSTWVSIPVRQPENILGYGRPGDSEMMLTVVTFL